MYYEKSTLSQSQLLPIALMRNAFLILVLPLHIIGQLTAPWEFGLLGEPKLFDVLTFAGYLVLLVWTVRKTRKWNNVAVGKAIVVKK